MGSFGVQRILLSHYQCRAKKKSSNTEDEGRNEQKKNFIHEEATNEKATFLCSYYSTQNSKPLRVTI